MNFSKWTGLGNDFVLLEPGESLDFGSGFEQRIIKLCDRRFGIGADGVVLVTPMDGEGCLVLNGVGGAGPASKAVANGVDFEMRIFNADGSEAAMCGNATRCVAKFIRSRGLAKSEDTKVFNLHTKSGLVRPTLLDDGRVCVDMGHPRTFLGSIKLTADCYDFTAETVSMGNPRKSACGFGNEGAESRWLVVLVAAPPSLRPSARAAWASRQMLFLTVAFCTSSTKKMALF